MLPNDRDGEFRDQKLGKTRLAGSAPPKDCLCPPQRCGVHALRHFGDTCAQFLWPFTLEKVLPIVQEQQASKVGALAYPVWGMQCRPQPVAGFKRGSCPCLEIENGTKPQHSKQNVPRSKAVIE